MGTEYKKGALAQLVCSNRGKKWEEQETVTECLDVQTGTEADGVSTSQADSGRGRRREKEGGTVNDEEGKTCTQTLWAREQKVTNPAGRRSQITSSVELLPQSEPADMWGVYDQRRRETHTKFEKKKLDKSSCYRLKTLETAMLKQWNKLTAKVREVKSLSAYCCLILSCWTLCRKLFTAVWDKLFLSVLSCFWN